MAKLSVDQSGQMVTAGKSSSERGTRSIVLEEGSFSHVLGNMIKSHKVDRVEKRNPMNNI